MIWLGVLGKILLLTIGVDASVRRQKTRTKQTSRIFTKDLAENRQPTSLLACKPVSMMTSQMCTVPPITASIEEGDYQEVIRTIGRIYFKTFGRFAGNVFFTHLLQHYFTTEKMGLEAAMDFHYSLVSWIFGAFAMTLACGKILKHVINNGGDYYWKAAENIDGARATVLMWRMQSSWLFFLVAFFPSIFEGRWQIALFIDTFIAVSLEHTVGRIFKHN